MFKLVNSLQRRTFLNCNILYKLPTANASYQFRIDKPVYYPDRQSEMKRAAEDQAARTAKAITEGPEPKCQPRDYYYKVLGVRKNASTQQIKTAYYALAKLFHPDTNRTAQETQRFKEISNAYHILTDDTRRLEYDQLGVVKDEQAFLRSVSNLQNFVATAQSANTNSLASNTNASNSMPIYENVSSNILRSNSNGGNMYRGNQIPAVFTKEELLVMASSEPKLELTFIEAAQGLKKNQDLRFVKKCPACNGKSPKLADRTSPEVCRKCNGVGQVIKRTATYTSSVICDNCNGRKFVSRNQCDTCDNRGIVLETTKVPVIVPAGIKTGELVVAENPVTKQRVCFRVTVQDSPFYKRIGNDVHTDKYITISEAILGCNCIIHGIYENISCRIDPGTESHSQIIIKGKGIKSRDGGIGNHIVTVKIRIPVQLSVKQRQLILALAKTEDPTFDFSG